MVKVSDFIIVTALHELPHRLVNI